MEIEEKERLARTNDMEIVACAIRLRAARKVAGLEQQELARLSGATKAALNNAEAALNFPSREVMKYLWRAYRIDFNFLMSGTFSQLPGDVQTALFPALEAATSEWDRKERSDQVRKKTKFSQV